MSSKTNSVLIVDDDPMNIMALAHILAPDYTVYAEADGKACLDAAKRLKPDLILLDIVMPELDGFGVIQRLKKDKDTKDIPVIFVTGLTKAQEEVKGFSLGAADFITKPFSPPVVSARVNHQIKILNQMREIQSLSATCILTGIANRHFFNTQLQQEWERAKKNKAHISFLMMDIDNFKDFNHAYGHLNGDVALQRTAKAITSAQNRTIDIAARWGGEEFVVLLPETTLEDAMLVAENIRDTVEKNIFTLLDETTKAGITVSMGVHSALPSPEDNYTLQNFISDTNAILCQAKANGTNHIMQFTSYI
ncbi:MAG: diguanylate cyclase [Defluviitaleaceae bacterium]|nr:diguanylate cyclase [Defluviitaleaceae bacterium]